MFLRVKYDKTTVFMTCNSSDKIDSLFNSLKEIVHTNDFGLCLDLNKKEMLDLDYSFDQAGLVNDSVVYLCSTPEIPPKEPI